MSAQQDPGAVEDSTNGDEAAETIFLTKDLAARAFRLWNAQYVCASADGESWSPDVAGDRSAEYFFDLCEEVAIHGV